MKIEPEFRKFFADNAEHKRYDYPELDKNSIVVDVGGYKGDFASRIIHKYGSFVYIFEPINEFCSHISNRLNKEGILNRSALTMGGLSNRDEIKTINLLDDGTSTIQRGKDSVECPFYNVIELLDTICDSNKCNIDLLKLNIEGDEFDILDELTKSHNERTLKSINNIQVQFHNFVDDCEERRDKIIKNLSKTHDQTWCYYFVWENWNLKNEK